MDQSQKHKLILKILIGSAWIDRQLDPTEIVFLEQVLERYDLLNDQELRGLLTSPIDIKSTESWIVEYFRVSSKDERLQLLAKIGTVLIADDQVTEIEHELIDDYHELMSRIPSHEPSESGFLSEIGKISSFVGNFVVQSINAAKKISEA